MRSFLAILALLIVGVVSVAGFRGRLSRRPPIELFSDMVRQPKIRPQSPNAFFPDAFGSRGPVAGAIARGQSFEDAPVNTGRVTGTTNFVDLIPMPVTVDVLRRGAERFNLQCLLCHGPQGNGRGITPQYGMVVIANLHDPRIVRMPDGEIYQTLTQGKNLMQGYGSSLDLADRWAVLAYVRALQLSHLGTLDDVPADQRLSLSP